MSENGLIIQGHTPAPSPIDLAAVADPDHEHAQGSVHDLVDDPVVTHADTIEALGSGEQLRTGRAWLPGQGIKPSGDAAARDGRQVAQRSGGPRSQLDKVAQERSSPMSDPQLRLELGPGDVGALLGECRTGGLDVQAVLEGLEKIEILDRDEGGHTLPPPLEHDALAAVGDAVDDVGELLTGLAGRQLSHGIPILYALYDSY